MASANNAAQPMVSSGERVMAIVVSLPVQVLARARWPDCRRCSNAGRSFAVPSIMSRLWIAYTRMGAGSLSLSRIWRPAVMVALRAYRSPCVAGELGQGGDNVDRPMQAWRSTRGNLSRRNDRSCNFFGRSFRMRRTRPPRRALSRGSY